MKHHCNFIKKCAGALALAVALGVSQRTEAQSYALTNGWVGPTTTTSVRGMAYGVLSNEVFIANTGGSIAVYDGTTGTSVGSVSFSGVTTSGAQVINQVGVADDGVIYGANLTTGVSAGSPYRIYRWPSWNSQGTVAYAGDPTTGGSPVVDGKRFGDSFAITGAGTSTWMIAGASGTSGGFALFSTADGTNYVATALSVPGFPTIGNGGFGLAFYTNNTFIAKPASGTTLYLIQFPANFASLAGTGATGTILASYTIATPSGASSSAVFSFSSNNSLLGATYLGSGSKYYGNLYSFNPSTGVTLLATTNSAAASNGNLTGGVAMGGNGKTNFLYVLNSANNMVAYGILAIPPQPPSITTQPVGGTGVYAPYTLSVSALGTSPVYQWQATNAAVAGAFTNLTGATNSTYVVAAAPLTNFYRVVLTNSAGSVTSSVVLVQTIKPVTNSAVASLWNIPAGTTGYSYLSANSDGTRGIAYDTNTTRVVVSSTAGLYVLNGNNGTNIETLSTTGVAFSGLLGGADQVGIADDGAVYVGNVVNNGGNFNLYRWSAPSNSVTATPAFSGDPGAGQAGSERWGDTLAIRGAGANTQILLGSRGSAPSGTNIAFLTANDGVGLTYSAVLIAVSNVPSGFAGYGISFGAGNTFWAKSAGGDLYEIAYDTNLLTGTVVFDYKQPSQIASGLICAGVDPVRNIFASITDSETPHDLQLFQLTGTADAPVLFQQSFFASANGNGNGNAVVCVKYPRMYALDVNNGIVAITYGVPATTAPSISTPPASITAYTNAGSLTLSVGASGSLPLYYQWRYNATNIPGATGSVFVITNTALKVGGYYDVVVHNVAGSVTSAPPALVTLIAPTTSPLVTPLWNITAGTNGAWLTASGYETRGLAYDPISTNLFVADHNNIHAYSGTNGSYLFEVNTVGLPTGGVNGWTVDQVGVADDGTLYSANLSVDGTGFSIISYGSSSYTPNYAYVGASGGSDLSVLDPGERWGDTMAVRGSGSSTEILFGSYNGTNVALFTTTDGSTFTPTLIAVQGGVPLGFAGLGIAFGTNNTFYAKGGHNYNLREVAFDPVAGTGTVLQVYTAGTQVPNDLTGLGVDVTNNILGGVCYNDSPNDAQLYLLSGNSNAPALFNQDFFPSVNPNYQENSVVTLKQGLGYALNVNNGIVAFSYSLPAAPAVTLTSVAYLPHSVTITWNNTFDGHAYQLYYKNRLTDATWTLLGTVTATDATASYTDTTATGAARFYQVVSQ